MTMMMVKVETCWICKHKITEDHISANKKFYHPGCMKVTTLQLVTSHCALHPVFSATCAARFSERGSSPSKTNPSVRRTSR